MNKEQLEKNFNEAIEKTDTTSHNSNFKWTPPTLKILESNDFWIVKHEDNTIVFNITILSKFTDHEIISTIRREVLHNFIHQTYPKLEKL